MLRLKTALGALLICAAIPLAGAAPASAGSFTQCGDGIVNGSGWFNLKAQNAACKVVRKLADHYVFEAGGSDDGFKNWSCSHRQIGDEVWRAKCVRDKDGVTQRAKFKYGA